MSRRLAKVVKKLPFGPLHKVQRGIQDPAGVQLNLLRSLIQHAKDTEWGRRFDYEGLLREDDLASAYRDRVPLKEYEEMRPYVERIRAGEADVLWSGVTKYFAASSGTTSTGKIIPVSSDMIRCNRDFGFAVLQNYLANRGRIGIFGGKIMALPGWLEDDTESGKGRIGQISAILSEGYSWVSKPWQALDNRLAFISQWEEKMDAIAEHSIDQDIRMIAITPSWGQVLFRSVLAKAREKGRPATTLEDIWPNLTVIITGGVALRGYKDIFDHYVGGMDVDYVETYGASEGFLSFQSDLSDPAMLLHVNNGVYLEFVPIEDLGSPHPRRLSIEEVEVGARYAPFLSTNSGFWAYGVGDVLRFTSTNPHKILVIGRTIEMLDKYGEAVFGEDARAALHAACRQTGARVLQFHITHTDDVVEKAPAHHWLIEFEQEPPDVKAFMSIIDAELKTLGHHYEDRREGMAFGPPVASVLPKGTFFKYFEATGKRITVQTKVPAMSEEQSLAAELLAWLDQSEGVSSEP